MITEQSEVLSDPAFTVQTGREECVTALIEHIARCLSTR